MRRRLPLPPIRATAALVAGLLLPLALWAGFAGRWGVAILAPLLGAAVIGLAGQVVRRRQLEADHAELAAYHARTQSEAARHQGELRQEVARREAVEAELRTSREQLRLVLANAPLLIFTLDRAARITLLEGQGAERLGMETRGLVGQPVRALTGGHDVLDDAVERAMAGETLWVSTDFHGVPFEFHHRPLLDGDGRVTGLVGVALDISERGQVERLKREFMASVTHELRTPLTSILGALGLLSGGAMGELSPSARRLLDIARSNGERLLALVNDILDLEKVDRGELAFRFRDVDLNTLLQQVVDAHEPYAAQYRATLELVPAPGEPCVRADPDRILQVLANLISNAAKHSPEGGTIRVLAEPRGERIEVRVEDEGPGIPEATRKQLFQRFTPAAASGRGGGSGLGLAIARALVERHGGHLDYVNYAEGGACFFFDLLRTDPP
ncbi:MAG: ATP-binding protein [Thiohalospira sp.]